MADHLLYAAAHDRLLAVSEARGLAERRRQLLARAEGRVLEIGAGTGLNLAHYPPDSVTSLVALEPNGAMLRRLLRRIGTAGCPVPFEVREAGIGQVDFPDGSFDTVVSTLVLCTVPSPDEAVADIRRWLAPDGQLLFLEHVHAAGWKGGLQSLVAPMWRYPAAGCRLDRDILAVLRQAHFFVTDCERFAMPAGGVLFSACVQGVARPTRW